ncbi:hypothetical protein DND132_1971 [Pseudodesulfovibrio mercurii]|uniref:Uncharacterized protein n=1 Tax=Pseudodesulfovibrio mercurii TaxID=641491 RepID=F0JGY7_9BACT|nr:hypothetical protein [Pseudodesulfovibrio mercurii]EGB15177.1 hypothetical protein DND132_1971 [Pseudodesulfovibrio mercurii]
MKDGSTARGKPADLDTPVAEWGRMVLLAFLCVQAIPFFLISASLIAGIVSVFTAHRCLIAYCLRTRFRPGRLVASVDSGVLLFAALHFFFADLGGSWRDNALSIHGAMAAANALVFLRIAFRPMHDAIFRPRRAAGGV